jgi:adenylate cyclase
MKILAPARLARAAGTLLALCVISLFFADALDHGLPLLGQVELKTYDMRLRALPSTPPRHVTIAAIDEASLARIGRWPWSRTTFAALAERLDRLGAKVIAFDLFYPERESAGADAAFANAIRSTNKVVLGSVFIDNYEEVRYLGPAGLAAARLAIAPQAIADVRSSATAEPVFRRREPHGVLVNILELQGGATYVGHIDVPPDPDGVVRRAPLVRRFDGRYFPGFDAQVARAYLGAEVPVLELASYGIAALQLGGRTVPLDEEGRLLVRHRRPGSFAAVSIADILEDRADPALLRGRVVLVGNTATGIGDARVTPFGATLPGVEVRASIIESLLQGDALQRPEWMMFVDAAAMALMAVVLIALLPRLGVAAGGVLAAALLAGYVALAIYLFPAEVLWLNLVYPVLLAVALFASATLVQHFFALSEKRYLKRAFQHYVPPAVVEDLVADAGRLRLGGEKRELTVLFSDIRGFTALSEGMEPEELVKLMNEYFTAMTQEVFRQRGSLDKYIGDAVMAIFGAPIAEPEHPRLACRAALGMVSALRTLQEQWRKEGKPSVEIGIGINTGPMVAGNMGSASRFNYTVVGDAVNLTSRIETLNKTYGTNILVSESTYERVRDEFRAARDVDCVRVRGRAQPVRLYELIPEGRYAALDWLDEYRAAYDAMRAGEVARASAAFQALHARVGDHVSAYHARLRQAV